jgi:cell division protein FtsB
VGDFLERGLPLGILLVSLVSVPTMVLRPEGLTRMRGLEAELARVQEQNLAMKRDVNALRADVARLRDDPKAVERIARDQLGMVRKNEIVVHFARP